MVKRSINQLLKTSQIPIMPPLKISKKHHRHFNNPFPSLPKSLPQIHGSLSYERNLPLRRVYDIGEDFQILWSSDNGGYISASHKSHPDRSLWSTIPGEAFISAAAVKSEAEESRGSFVIRDGGVSFICDSQTIDEIIICDDETEMKVNDVPGELLKVENPPALLISGRVSSKKARRSASKSFCFWARKLNLQSAAKLSLTARYWVFFHQKNRHQIEFQVKFGELEQQPGPRVYRKFSEGFQSLKWKRFQHGRRRSAACLFSAKDFLGQYSDDEWKDEKAEEFKEFTRVFLTYSSEKDEKIYGFGEQFSHMEFKGRRVPILVQEQGIGRGDQPITFAANLVSFRSGGDWSTTYAPSPFYMTSKMRCLYLEGYNYSVFDLTEHDRVQIQVNSFEDPDIKPPIIS